MVEKNLEHSSSEDNALEIDIALHDIDPTVLALVPQALAVQFGVIPLAVRNRVLYLAMFDPANLETVIALEFATGCRVEGIRWNADAIRAGLEKFYGEIEIFAEEEEEESDAENDEVVAAAVKHLVEALEAVEKPVTVLNLDWPTDKAALDHAVAAALAWERGHDNARGE
jgi:hypothetical protein